MGGVAEREHFSRACSARPPSASARSAPCGSPGPDRYWDGRHDFGKLSAREAHKTQPARTGPRRDELGTFATLISRFGPTLTPAFEEVLRTPGEGR